MKDKKNINMNKHKGPFFFFIIIPYKHTCFSRYFLFLSKKNKPHPNEMVEANTALGEGQSGGQ